MTRVCTLVVWLVGSLLAGGAWFGCAPEAPPNLLLISLDTTRRDHLPFYGYERDTAPRMSELADRGIVFDEAVSVHTNTAPAHASMLTGLYPMQHGIERNGQRLRDDVATLAERLSARGYATAAFVSGWTLTRHTGLDRGFGHWDQSLREELRRSAEWTVAAALPWLDAREAEGRPFFLFFHLFDPHYAYAPPEATARRFLPAGAGAFTTDPSARDPGPKEGFPLDAAGVAEFVARYDGEIAHADHHLGVLLDHLASLGLADDTVVVFTSDHGETLYERGWVFDHGARTYEEQVRIPLVIRLPGDLHAGTRVATPASHVDLLPTLLEVLGLAPVADVAGRTLVPLFAGNGDASDAARATFSHARPETNRVPELGVPLLDAGLVAAVRASGMKLIQYPSQEGWVNQLFDLGDDPGETRNLAVSHPESLAELTAELARFRRETGAGRRAPAPLSPDVEAALRELGYVE